MPEVVELRRQNWLSRRLEDASVSGLVTGNMLVLALICTMFGIVLGRCIFVLQANAEAIEAYRQKEDITQVYLNRLHSDLQARGFEPPAIPKELQP